MRPHSRANDALRPMTLQRRFLDHPAGSVLITAGQTRVLCCASIVPGVPTWREASGRGWLTAEYEMLPAATHTRRPRDRTKVDGRSLEIQRLVGRALRAAVDLAAIGPNTIHIDCDVLQADGGTRTASITGAYVALRDALTAGAERRLWTGHPHRTAVAAVSVGIVAGEARLDLDYAEDATAEVDCNLVLTGAGEWIEWQATGEDATFSDAQIAAMTSIGRAGLTRLLAFQQRAIEAPPGEPVRL